MTGPFGTTAGPWRTSGDICPECWFIETDDGDFIAQCEDRRGFASLDAVTNAAAIAQVPAMLELVRSVYTDSSDAVLAEMARKIVAELEEN